MQVCHCVDSTTRFSLLEHFVRPLLGRHVVVCFMLAGLSSATSAESVAPVVDNPGPYPHYDDAPVGAFIGSGAGYSRSLDSVLRVRFNTQDYGQDEGSLDLGTFKAFPYGDDALSFLDGQIKLSDRQGVGFSLGAGIRFLSDTLFTPDPQRVIGMSVWADGTSTEADAFFSQVGVSVESLGDLWDVRFNGYVPVTGRRHLGDAVASGTRTFLGNSLAIETISPFDTAFYAADIEGACRLGNREAWGFLAAYGLNSGDEDTLGYRAGVRGYAYPDLLLQCAVSRDDIFKTNVGVSITWFVGRTRTDYCPTCSALDRLREPVLRNDYVVVHTTTRTSGVALTDADGDALRFVHVDSGAAGGGTGTFESPLNSLDDIQPNSMAGDIVLLYADSTFTGQNAILQDDQRLLGEGEGMVFQVTTFQGDTIDIPESSTGARDGTKPTIASSVGSAITIADNNEVANLLIDGNGVTTTGIAGADTDGSTDPNLHDLMIQETTGDGIALRAGARVDTDDVDNDSDTTEMRIPFAVTIDDVMFDQVAGNDIDIDAQTDGGLDPDDSDVDLSGDIVVSNIMSTNNIGGSLLLANTNEADGAGKLRLDTYDYDGGVAGLGGLDFTDIDGELILQNFTANNGTGGAARFTNLTANGLVNIDNMTYDGGTGTASGLIFNNVDSNVAGAGVTVTNSSFTNGTGDGVSILGESEGMFSFAATNTFDSVDGTTFLVNGVGSTFMGELSVAADITNDTGFSVDLLNVQGGATEFAVTFNGDITDTGQGISVTNNTGTQVALFTGDLDLDTGTANAIFIDANGVNTEIDFAGSVDINTTSGQGFTATGGGQITVAGTNNQISADSDIALDVRNMTIGNAGVNFEEVNLSTGAATVNAVRLENLTGGNVRIGPSGAANGAGGTIAATTGDAIVISNVENAAINGVEINNGGNANAAVHITDSAAGEMNVSLDNVDVTSGALGIQVTGGGTGAFSLDIDNSSVTNAGQTGLDFNNVDNGTVSVADTDIDGSGTTSIAGIDIVNSNATFTFDSLTTVTDVPGIGFQVVGGTGNVSMNGDINNTAGTSISITGIDGGSVTFTGDVVDSGTGIDIVNNDGGSVLLAGTYDLDTTTNTAVEISDNDGVHADVSVGGLDITTTTGTGFTATGGGDLTVNGTNTISTTQGVALDIDGMNIVSQANFQQVDVMNGSAGGIDLTNVTGSPIAIGSTTGAAGSLTTTGSAISLTNVANVTINNTDIAAAGSTSIDIMKTGSSAMRVTLNDVDVNEASQTSISADVMDGLFRLDVIDSAMSSNVDIDASSNDPFGLFWDNSTVNTDQDVALDLAFSSSVTAADVIIQGGQSRLETTSNAAGAAALSVNVSGSGPDIDFALDDTVLRNTASAGPTADFTIAGGSLFDANIRDNTFTNSGAGNQFEMTSNGPTTSTRLFLNNNSAVNYELTTDQVANPPFNFNVVDTDAVNFSDTKNNNTGTVTFTPAEANFNAISGPITDPSLP